MERDFLCPSIVRSANFLWIKKKSYLQTANQHYVIQGYSDIKKAKFRNWLELAKKTYLYKLV